MKATIVYIFITCALQLTNSSYANAQNKMTSKQPRQMLNEFYSAYSKIKFIPKDVSKLDSLQKKFCTLKLREEAKEWFNDGHDLLTDDWGMDMNSLKTMTIVKDPIKTSTYIISYVVNSFPESPIKPVPKKVTLYIGVVEESGSYKIASVK